MCLHPQTGSKVGMAELPSKDEFNDEARAELRTPGRDHLLTFQGYSAVSSPRGSVFRTFRACTVAMARRPPGGTQVLQKLAGLLPTYSEHALIRFRPALVAANIKNTASAPSPQTRRTTEY